MFAVNAIGLLVCCREAAKRMSTRHGGKRGSIVNVSSMAAIIGGRPGASAYAASEGSDHDELGNPISVGANLLPGVADSLA